jgi:hypothetical protein
MKSEVQPLLDWLATNHHDFMRVNDLSEAFAILGWLAPARVPTPFSTLTATASGSPPRTGW